MSQPDDEFARKIVGHLDYSADHLDQTTRERLLEARKVALSRYKEQPEPAWGLALAGSLVTGHAGQWLLSARYLLVGAALIAALLGIAYWQSVPGLSNEIAEIDAGLLTDDLPINAYLDKAFDSWLKRSLR